MIWLVFFAVTWLASAQYTPMSMPDESAPSPLDRPGFIKSSLLFWHLLNRIASGVHWGIERIVFHLPTNMKSNRKLSYRKTGKLSDL